MKPKSNRGGPREGSGRKKGKPVAKISIAYDKEKLQQLRDLHGRGLLKQIYKFMDSLLLPFPDNREEMHFHNSNIKL